MSKLYWARFGAANPREFAGLSPTFTTFIRNDGSSLAPPSITEIGVSTGMYGFTFAVGSTFSVGFTIDGGGAIADQSARYVTGSLDPIIDVDRRVGFEYDPIGGTFLGATTVFALVNRFLAYLEADETFNKTTGAWQKYQRGSSTLILSKDLSNNVSEVTKVD